jgi:hypothetical protein
LRKSREKKFNYKDLFLGFVVWAAVNLNFRWVAGVFGIRFVVWCGDVAAVSGGTTGCTPLRVLAIGLCQSCLALGIRLNPLSIVSALSKG